MKDATYQDGILTVRGKRYCEIDKFDGGDGFAFMRLREEDDTTRKKKGKTAEWVFPQEMEEIEDYDWENTRYLKKIA